MEGKRRRELGGGRGTHTRVPLGASSEEPVSCYAHVRHRHGIAPAVHTAAAAAAAVLSGGHQSTATHRACPVQSLLGSSLLYSLPKYPPGEVDGAHTGWPVKKKKDRSKREQSGVKKGKEKESQYTCRKEKKNECVELAV